MMKKSIFTCPNCKNNLKFYNNTYKCNSCASNYQIIDDIPIFSKNSNHYYGEMAKEIFLELLDFAKKTSTQTALNTFYETKKITSYAYNYGSASNRGIFFILLKPCNKHKVLDLGCGWGNVSINLARYSGHCFSMDLTKERIAFLSTKAKELSLNNITGICGGDLPYLPFQDNFLDCVVLNGVLEWVPESMQDLSPEQAQLKFLIETARVLKPNGQLYLAIENRFALDYFKGYPDDHVGLSYVSIMPRVLANFISKIKRKKPYRTYTYSRIGYRKLLKKANFRDIKFYIPWRNYRTLDVIFVENYSEAFLNHIANTSYTPTWRTKIKSYLLPYLTHSFSIVADKNPKKHQSSWLSLFLSYIKEKHDKERSIYSTIVINTDTSGMGIIVSENDEEGYYIGIPVDDQSLANHRLQIECLNYLHKKYATSGLVDLIPKVIDSGYFYNVPYFLYELIKSRKNPSIDRQEQLMLNLCSFFAENSCKKKEECRLPKNLQQERIMQAIRSCNIVVNEIEFSKKYKYIVNKAGKFNIHVHGDLWPKNIIPHQNGRYFIVDWPDFEKEGFPLHDLFHFYLYPASSTQGFWDYMMKFAQVGFTKDIEDQLISATYKTYRSFPHRYFTSERLSALFILYLYDNIVRRILSGNNEKIYLEKLLSYTIDENIPLPAFIKISNKLLQLPK